MLVGIFFGESFKVGERIPQKHKFTVEDLKTGEAGYLYGVLVGRATVDIPKGHCVTVANFKHDSASYDDQKESYSWTAPDVEEFKSLTFDGYYRTDGRVGTLNVWPVIPLVFCENRNVDLLEELLAKALGYQTKTDFTVGVDSLINNYKAGATADELYATTIIQSQDERI